MKNFLVKQAMVAAIAYIIIILTVFIPTNKDKTLGYKFSEKLAAAFAMVIPAIFSIYSINCFVTGKCDMWAWVNTGSIVFLAILIVFGFRRRANMMI